MDNARLGPCITSNLPKTPTKAAALAVSIRQYTHFSGFWLINLQQEKKAILGEDGLFWFALVV
jgi:hypothetical protein